MKYYPTEAMPYYYDLCRMIEEGLDYQLAIDVLMHDRTLPLRVCTDEYENDPDNPVITALLSLGWIKERCEKTYKIGQKFRVDSCEYLLAQVSAKHVALICLKRGNRWRDPQKVENTAAITQDEMLSITNGKPFTLIEE